MTAYDLYNDTQFLAEYTIKTDTESGGFLIKALHGNIGVVGLQRGEDREIDFRVNEPLHEKEKYYGTFHCTTPDIILLGDNKQISEYKVNDRVVSQNGLQTVKMFFSHDFKGTMYRIKGVGVLPFMLTENHPLLVSKVDSRKNNHKKRFSNLAWLNPAELIEHHTKHDGHYMVVPRVKGTLTTKSIDIRSFVGHHKFGGNKEYCTYVKDFPLNEDTAWLLGIYVAEGCDGGGRLDFGLNINEKNTIGTKIKNIITKFGYSSGFAPRGQNGIVMHVYSRILSKVFTEWCGHLAPNKKIPDFILFNKDEKLLEAFLDGYWQGDGNKSNKDKEHSTSSRILALQLQLAYARLGLFACIYYRKREPGYVGTRKIKTAVGEYTVTAKIPSFRDRVKVTDEGFLVPIRQVRQVPYEGQVNNIETEDGAYLIQNVITHNSHPKTSTFSTGDCKSYLQDDLEHLMMNTGSNKEINAAIKLPHVTEMISDDIEFDELGLEQEDMPAIADVFKFIYYHGDPGEHKLQLMNPAVETWETGIQIEEIDVSLEDALERLGVTGTSHLPDAYNTKKWPSYDEINSTTYNLL